MRKFKMALRGNNSSFNDTLFQTDKTFLANASFNITSEINSSVSSLRLPFDNVGVIVAASFIFPTAILGIFCNIITVVVIHSSEKLKRSIFNLYIISLSVSDLISSMISPLMFYRRTWGHAKWNLPAFLCKVYWGGDLITSIGTSLHILVFCALRYLAIAKPHAFSCVRTKHVKISISIIWTIATLCGSFTFGLWFIVIDRSKETAYGKDFRPSCTINSYWIKECENFGVYGNVVFYYFPLVGIVVFSLLIRFTLLSRRTKRIADRGSNSINESEMKRQQKENQAIVQLFLIVVSYLFGYVPLSVYYILTHYLNNEVLKWWLNIISYICMRLSESMNPFFYNLGSSVLREETMKLLHKMFCCKQKPLQDQVVSMSDVRRSDVTLQTNRK